MRPGGGAAIQRNRQIRDRTRIVVGNDELVALVVDRNGVVGVQFGRGGVGVLLVLHKPPSRPMHMQLG